MVTILGVLFIIGGIVVISDGDVVTGVVGLIFGVLFFFGGSSSSSKSTNGGSSKPPEPPGPPGTVQSDAVCPVCGTRAGSGVIFCPNCGTKLTH